MVCKSSCEHTHNFHLLLISLGELPGVELLSHFVSVCFIYKLPKCFPKQWYHFAFPPAMYECFSYSTSCKLGIMSVSLLIVSILMCRGSNWGIIEAQMAFPDDQWCWAPFQVFAGNLYIYFSKFSVKKSFVNYLLGSFIIEL